MKLLAQPLMADFVAKIGDHKRGQLKRSLWSRSARGVDGTGSGLQSSYEAHRPTAGGGLGTNLASRRKFCAIAASVNSSCAPQGPRNRRRFSRRMRLRCANSISTRFRSWRDCSKASVLTSARATSRASSWMLRGILRSGAFGQHFDFSGQGPQSEVLAR